MFKTHPCLVFWPPRVLASPCLLFPALFSLFRQDYQGLMRGESKKGRKETKEEAKSEQQRLGMKMKMGGTLVLLW